MLSLLFASNNSLTGAPLCSPPTSREGAGSIPAPLIPFFAQFLTRSVRKTGIRDMREVFEPQSWLHLERLVGFLFRSTWLPAMPRGTRRCAGVGAQPRQRGSQAPASTSVSSTKPMRGWRTDSCSWELSSQASDPALSVKRLRLGPLSTAN